MVGKTITIKLWPNNNDNKLSLLVRKSKMTCCYLSDVNRFYFGRMQFSRLFQVKLVILPLQKFYDILLEKKESVLDKSSYVVGHVMVLYSPDWTNIGFSFILLTLICFVTLLLSSRDYTDTQL